MTFDLIIDCSSCATFDFAILGRPSAPAFTASLDCRRQPEWVISAHESLAVSMKRSFDLETSEGANSGAINAVY